MALARHHGRRTPRHLGLGWSLSAGRSPRRRIATPGVAMATPTAFKRRDRSLHHMPCGFTQTGTVRGNRGRARSAEKRSKAPRRPPVADARLCRSARSPSAHRHVSPIFIPAPRPGRATSLRHRESLRAQNPLGERKPTRHQKAEPPSPPPVITATLPRDIHVTPWCGSSGNQIHVYRSPSPAPSGRETNGRIEGPDMAGCQRLDIRPTGAFRQRRKPWPIRNARAGTYSPSAAFRRSTP